MKTYLHLFLRFFHIIFLWAIFDELDAQAILQGTASFLNSGSRPAAGVDISAFGASTVPTTESGMFILKFPDKKPGDKVKIIVGSKDRTGTALELVNDKVLAQMHIPSKPDDDIVEIIVCKVGQRNDAALRYNGIIVKTINEHTDKRLQEIDKKLGAVKLDAETIVSLQNEKEKLAAERDSALAKAEEQALFMASINLDKANQLVKEAMMKVDSLQDISGAIQVLDNEMLYQAYLEASAKKKKAEAEIQQVIAGFEFKINLLKPLYRFAEIAECYEKIAGIYEKEDYGKEKLAKNLSEAANYWGFYGGFQKQLELNQKALAIREKILPTDHPDLAGSYYNLAVTYRYTGDYQKALEFNLKSFSILEKVLPAEHPDLALSYNDLGLTYRGLGEHQKALEFHLKALAIREKILHTDHPDLAQSYNNLGATYYDLGDYQKALEFILKAFHANEKNLSPDHPELARSYANVAWMYQTLGEYQKALDLNLKAIDIREKVLPRHHPDLAQSYANLGVNYYKLGDNQKALEFDLKALSIREKVLSPDHPDLVGSYNDLGVFYGESGDQQKSMEFALKALSIRERVLPPDHPDLANAYNNIGFSYYISGEYEKSLEYYFKAQTIKEKVLLPNHPDLVALYNSICMAYAKNHQFPEAKTFLEKYQSISNEPRLFRDWAAYYALQNEKDKAIDNLKKAVEMGYNNLNWIMTDSSLENIRSEKGYKEIVKQLQKQ